MKKFYSLDSFGTRMRKLYSYFYKFNHFQKAKSGRFGTRRKNPKEMEEVVMQVTMDCNGCAKTVKQGLEGFKGVEEVAVDYEAQTVVAKGCNLAADAMKLVEWVNKKTGKHGRRRVQLLWTSSSLNPTTKEEEEEEEEEEEDNKGNVRMKEEEINKEELNMEKEKAEKPKKKKSNDKKKGEDELKPEREEGTQEVKIVTLKIWLHCEDCAQRLKKLMLRKKGVQMVQTDVKNSTLKVTGLLTAESVVGFLKRTIKVEYLNVRAVREESMKKKSEKTKTDDNKASYQNKRKNEKVEDEDENDHSNISRRVNDQKKDANDGGDGGGGGGGSGRGRGRRKPETAAVKIEQANAYNREKMMRALYYYQSSTMEEIFSDENPNACFVM